MLGGDLALRDELVLRPCGLEVEVALCACVESGGGGERGMDDVRKRGKRSESIPILSLSIHDDHQFPFSWFPFFLVINKIRTVTIWGFP